MTLKSPDTMSPFSCCCFTLFPIHLELPITAKVWNLSYCNGAFLPSSPSVYISSDLMSFKRVTLLKVSRQYNSLSLVVFIIFTITNKVKLNVLIAGTFPMVCKVKKKCSSLSQQLVKCPLSIVRSASSVASIGKEVSSLVQTFVLKKILNVGGSVPTAVSFL